MKAKNLIQSIRSDTPPRGSAAELTKEAWDAMDEEERVFLQDVADEVRRILIADGEAAGAAYLVGQRLGIDEHMALWWLLPSHIRSALKRGGRES